MSSFGSVEIACPICGEALPVPVDLHAPRLRVVGGRQAVGTIEPDFTAVREHVSTHRGPDGDGGEPLPVSA